MVFPFACLSLGPVVPRSCLFRRLQFKSNMPDWKCWRGEVSHHKLHKMIVSHCPVEEALTLNRHAVFNHGPRSAVIPEESPIKSVKCETERERENP